jgi:hypothetical protein
MNFLDLSGIAISSPSYISMVFDDLKPILTIVFGLMMGFAILEYIIDLAEEFMEKREARKEYERKLELEAIKPVMEEFHKHEVERKREEMIKEA